MINPTFLTASGLSREIPNLDPNIKEFLQQQTITEDSPGRILKDWQTLLDFIGSSGVEVSGQNDYFPMKILPEINTRLSTPIEIDLKRPQQKSYPYLHGLYLLLRLLGLAYPIREGKKSKLIIDQDLLKTWQQLNATERYLILLEAWVFWASSEFGSMSGFLLLSNTWARLPSKGVKITPKNAGQFNLDHLQTLTYLALFDLFGLVKLKQGKPLPGKGWRITYLEKTPFGEGMMQVLVRSFMTNLTSDNSYFDDETTYGQLQPLLQEFFPDYQHQFIIPDPNKSTELSEGVDQFKVSLGNPWRRILVPSDLTLEPLVNSILTAFNFDKDHLYQFICKNRLGRELYINHSSLEDPPYTHEFRIKELPLKIGDTMIFLFDFGDNWKFSVLLEAINPPDEKVKKPLIKESWGKSPEQYGFWEDED